MPCSIIHDHLIAFTINLHFFALPQRRRRLHVQMWFFFFIPSTLEGQSRKLLVFKFQIHVIRFSNFWCRDVLNIKFLNNHDIERQYYHYFACNAITLLERDLNAHQLFIFKRFYAMRMRARERHRNHCQFLHYKF